MARLIFYTDEASMALVTGRKPVVILVGGDFGYANFGDVLQLKSVVNFYRAQTDLNPVPVYSLEAIPDSGYVDRIKKLIGVDALLFLSAEAVDVARLGLIPVPSISCLSVVHLYGGGYLNDRWGEYVLDVAECFLDKSECITYLISGQQVGEKVRARLLDHIDRFRPRLVGVRDFESLDRLESWGVPARFSFDDAYEPLLDLANQVPKIRKNRVIGHINLSPYASDSVGEKAQMLVAAFREIMVRYPEHELVMVNAYNDRRSAVMDSLASIVELENEFPYKDYCVLDLVDGAYSGNISRPELLSSEVAVSCSYHVTLFLHIAGVPCWLFAQNAYYDQKAGALNGMESYEEFLQKPVIPDYSERIDLREAWLRELGNVIEVRGPEVDAIALSLDVDAIDSLSPFKFKPRGHEALERQLAEQAEQLQELRNYCDDLRSSLQQSLAYQEELERSRRAQSGQIDELRSYVDSLEARSNALAVELDQAHRILGSRKELIKFIVRSRR